MILAGKYEILERVGGAAITVDRARNSNSGKTVYLHRLAAGSPVSGDVVKLALRYSLRFPNSGVLIDVIDDEGATYVVTEEKREYISLLDFLPWALAGGVAAGSVSSFDATGVPFGSESAAPVQRPPEPRETRVVKVGDFTRAFNTERPVPQRGGVQRTGSAPQPGEFTRMFEMDSPAAAEKPVADREPEFPRTASATPSAKPGEFTRMFSMGEVESSAGDPFPLPLAPDVKEKPPGEYTRMFGQDFTSFTPDSRDSTADLFRERTSRTEPAQTPPAISGPGAYTQVLSGNVLHDTPPAQATPAPEKAPASEINLPAKPQLPTITPLATPTAPSIKLPGANALAMTQPRLHKKGVSPILILLAALLVAAVAVVVFIVSRR